MASSQIAVRGLPVWLPSRAELLTAIEAQVAAATGSVRTVRLFTLNPEIVMLALRDPTYSKTLAAAEWNVVDGVGLSIAIRLRGSKALRSLGSRGAVRHPGSDLVHDLAAAVQRAGRPLLVIGGTPDRLRKACDRLRAALPRLRVEGFSPAHTPRLPFREQVDLERAIEALRPAAVVVCLGAPKQERWIEESLACLNRADVRIAAGLGGVVDFLSGEISRAPHWARRIGAEWLYRLYIEPSRWKRQLGSLPAFAIRALFSPRFISPRIDLDDSAPS